MAEMLGSFSRCWSVGCHRFLAGKHEAKIELAHIEMKAALETSDRCREALESYKQARAPDTATQC
jgi:hypothetical protein